MKLQNIKDKEILQIMREKRHKTYPGEQFDNILPNNNSKKRRSNPQFAEK